MRTGSPQTQMVLLLLYFKRWLCVGGLKSLMHTKPRLCASFRHFSVNGTYSVQQSVSDSYSGSSGLTQVSRDAFLRLMQAEIEESSRVVIRAEKEVESRSQNQKKSRHVVASDFLPYLSQVLKSHRDGDLEGVCQVWAAFSQEADLSSESKLHDHKIFNTIAGLCLKAAVQLKKIDLAKSILVVVERYPGRSYLPFSMFSNALCLESSVGSASRVLQRMFRHQESLSKRAQTKGIPANFGSPPFSVYYPFLKHSRGSSGEQQLQILYKAVLQTTRNNSPPITLFNRTLENILDSMPDRGDPKPFSSKARVFKKEIEAFQHRAGKVIAIMNKCNDMIRRLQAGGSKSSMSLSGEQGKQGVPASVPKFAHGWWHRAQARQNRVSRFSHYKGPLRPNGRTIELLLDKRWCKGSQRLSWVIRMIKAFQVPVTDQIVGFVASAAGRVDPGACLTFLRVLEQVEFDRQAAKEAKHSTQKAKRALSTRAGENTFKAESVIFGPLSANHLLNAVCQARHLPAAATVWNDMRDRFLFPSRRAVLDFMRISARLHQLQLTKSLRNFLVEKKQYTFNRRFYSALVESSASLNPNEDSNLLQCFNDLVSYHRQAISQVAGNKASGGQPTRTISKPSIHNYNSIIRILTLRNKPKLALDLINKMHLESQAVPSIAPVESTYVSILRNLSGHDSVHFVEWILVDMLRKGIPFTQRTVAALDPKNPVEDVLEKLKWASEVFGGGVDESISSIDQDIFDGT